MDTKDFIEVGKVVKTHGINGELIIELDNPEILENNNEPVALEIEGLRVPFFLEHAKAVSAQRARVQFDCTHTEQRAKTLVGCKLFVNPETFDGIDDEFASPNALVGFDVVDKNYGNIGKLVSVENLNINPFMVVGDNADILIPFHPDIVGKIDFKKRVIKITAPNGLIDINR